MEQLKMIKYISDECGAGKTQSIIKSINNSTDINTKYLLVQNTIKLIAETEKQFTCSCKVITSEQYSNAFDTCVEYMTSTVIDRVTIITDKIFYKLPIELLKSFKIYVDDCVDFHQFDSIQILNDEHKLSVVREMFELKDKNFNGKYSVLKINNERDDLESLIKSKLERFANMDRIYGNTSFFTDECDKDTRTLSVLGIIDIEKYKDLDLDITYLANDFENTLLYKSNPAIFQKVEIALLERSAPVSERLKVFYFLPNSTYNATWRDNNQNSYKQIIQYLNCNVSNYYWTGNNSDNVKLNGAYVPPQTRGVNSLTDYSTCIWLCSMKPSRAESGILASLFGLTSEDIIQAREIEMFRQFVMRGSIRKFDSADEMIVYCVDEYQARQLSQTPTMIDIGLSMSHSEKVPALNTNQRKRISRFLAKNPSLIDFKNWLGQYKNSDLTVSQKQKLLKKFLN
ncbi:hypothetical protein NHU85_11720 [Edwardsiella tarda]|uniref:hypothetical protein n=1 Tax=Edwardsiella tarda TaxID=636 RepID=UPI00267035EE|nr:hypothetical protein [Edwardsiella tarda]WKS80414.1 hypothetical protein NHU85_11720 [Edwardsiella tarda]